MSRARLLKAIGRTACVLVLLLATLFGFWMDRHDKHYPIAFAVGSYVFGLWYLWWAEPRLLRASEARGDSN